jgi:hypothetical protein
MAWESVESLVFLWWNTSLSPPIQKPKTREEDLHFVVAQIKHMRAIYSFAVLGLGEVSTDDLDQILSGVGDPTLAKVDATDRRKRLKFDTAIIYDLTKLELLRQPLSLTENLNGDTLKLGIVASFMIASANEVVQVVTSHWPSRRTLGPLESKRSEYGTWLRTRCQSLRATEASPYIVLMGDYNDDPFSPSLAEHLFATRDRTLAARDTNYFYNPFWRCLGESQPATFPETDVGVCGTHYHPYGKHTEWVTFDQIIFSSAFLIEGPLVLNEKYTGIVSTPDLTKALRQRTQRIDHFPVISVVTWRSLR